MQHKNQFPSAAANQMPPEQATAAEAFARRAATLGSTVVAPQLSEPRRAHAESTPAYDRERLAALLDSSPIVVETWLGSSTVPADKQSTPAGQFKLLYDKLSLDRARRLSEKRSTEANLDAFSRAHVPEIVTFTAMPKVSYEKVMPGSEKGGEPAVIMTYETVTRSRNNWGNPALETYKSAYLDGPERPGNYLLTHLVLPQSDAQEIREAMTADPVLAHDFVQTLMTDHFKVAPEDWQRQGPDYESWKQADGGVSRIAIRDSLKDGPQQSQVLSS